MRYFSICQSVSIYATNIFFNTSLPTVKLTKVQAGSTVPIGKGHSPDCNVCDFYIHIGLKGLERFHGFI